VSVESVFLSADSKYHREYLFISSKNTITTKRPLWHMAGCSDGRRKNWWGGLQPGQVDIDERPDVVDANLESGHWEADTVHAPDGYLVTLVERVSKLFLVAKVTRKTKDSVGEPSFDCSSRISISICVKPSHLIMAVNLRATRKSASN
jgi:IS30 family transposase